jgi:hypothetical protein
MSYSYQDPHYDNYVYKFVDDGNQGNDDYEYEYESYSDHTEPDHCKPDCHNHEHDTTHYNNHANREDNANDANREVNEAYQPQWSKYKGGEASQHGELAHGNRGTGEDWEERCG